MGKSCMLWLHVIITQIGRKCYNRSLIKMYARITVFCVSVMQYPKRMCCIRPYQYIVSIHSLESIHTLEFIHIYDGINTYLRINTYLGINTYIGINTYLRTVDSKVITAVWPYHASLRIVTKMVPRTAEMFITCRTRLTWIWRNMLLKKTGL